MIRCITINIPMLRITYHNSFHTGSRTSFAELICKIPAVEREWANFKYAQGITHRCGDYETRYFAMISKSFPETYTSFRVFEAARGVHNMLVKHDLLGPLNLELGRQCDYLNTELQTEVVIYLFKEVLLLVHNNFANALSEVEYQAVVMELLLRCVGGLRGLHNHRRAMMIIFIIIHCNCNSCMIPCSEA